MTEEFSGFTHFLNSTNLLKILISKLYNFCDYHEKKNPYFIPYLESRLPANI